MLTSRQATDLITATDNNESYLSKPPIPFQQNVLLIRHIVLQLVQPTLEKSFLSSGHNRNISECHICFFITLNSHKLLLLSCLTHI